MDKKHEKYHGLVSKLQDISDDKYTTGLASSIHQAASEYLHKNKGADGKVTWKDDNQHKKFSDSLWDRAADQIAKDYLKLDDAKIKELKKSKTADGESLWENMISQYLGGMKKTDFFDRVRDEGELTIETVLRTYVNSLAQRHLQYRHTALLRKEIKDPEDQDGVAAYLGMAKGHNKKALKPLKVPRKFKSLDEAMNTLSTAAQYLPKNYHPDKKDTYE